MKQRVGPDISCNSPTHFLFESFNTLCIFMYIIRQLNFFQITLWIRVVAQTQSAWIEIDETQWFLVSLIPSGIHWHHVLSVKGLHLELLSLCTSKCLDKGVLVKLSPITVRIQVITLTRSTWIEIDETECFLVSLIPPGILWHHILCVKGLQLELLSLCTSKCLDKGVLV